MGRTAFSPPHFLICEMFGPLTELQTSAVSVFASAEFPEQDCQSVQWTDRSSRPSQPPAVRRRGAFAPRANSHSGTRLPDFSDRAQKPAEMRNQPLPAFASFLTLSTPLPDTHRRPQWSFGPWNTSWAPVPSPQILDRR